MRNLNQLKVQRIKEAVDSATIEQMSRDGNNKRWEDYDTIKCPDGQIINMAGLIQEQAKAKAALIHLEPMFAQFANILRVVYTFHIKTQATDGYNLFVNPQFTANLTFEGKVFVMAHECMHCVLDHMRRGKQAGHNHERSNIAADYEVNQTLVDLGLFKESTVKKLEGYIDSKFSGWSYEHIYDANPPGGSGGNNNNSGESKDAEKNNGGGSGGSDGVNDPEFIKGWNKAMADYKAGKLKISK